MACYDKAHDRVDMGKAQVSHIGRRNIMSSQYHGTIGAAVGTDEGTPDA